MTEQEEQELHHALARLKEEHRDLDDAIMALEEKPLPDTLQIKRLKKRKLYLRDRIREIDDQIVPDITA
ncbi:MAG: YdcH family protein [Parvibaculaceae bacterium]